MSPFESESRMAAQLAPFTTVELMPYFLNMPFSCAITIGEQSVSAIMPKRMSGVSGAFGFTGGAAGAALSAADGGGAASSFFSPPHAASNVPPSVAAPRPAAPSLRNLRRESFFMTGSSEDDGDVELQNFVAVLAHRIVDAEREREAGTDPHRVAELGVRAQAERHGGGVAQAE